MALVVVGIGNLDVARLAGLGTAGAFSRGGCALVIDVGGYCVAVFGVAGAGGSLALHVVGRTGVDVVACASWFLIRVCRPRTRMVFLRDKVCEAGGGFPFRSVSMDGACSMASSVSRSSYSWSRCSQWILDGWWWMFR